MRRPATDINTRQKEILQFIIDSTRNYFRCPSVREICKQTGLSSTSTIQSHLNALERFGYIKRDPNKNRAITVLLNPDKTPITSGEAIGSQTAYGSAFEMNTLTLRNVPLIGTVAAGIPITAEQNIEDVLPLPSQLTGNSDCFLLRVHGESMRDIGMYEGDMIIVRSQQTANNGDIVVAQTEPDFDATVKRFYKENGHIRLQPENPDFDPIIVDTCTIAGKVIGLIRDRL